jgi:hypothetical protein
MFLYLTIIQCRFNACHHGTLSLPSTNAVARIKDIWEKKYDWNMGSLLAQLLPFFRNEAGKKGQKLKFLFNRK